ncbi:NAD(P)-dependent dehydrogenase (short-subunit alcohol dehydrogenase family) [Lactobacillus colini]|uniref:NAD(P)-dependent dehydrogenase (Short-subunit alcohol dehydrogenase family) n=1 Tax=Lactobacillus colini TaxID=1819254 RepID=A0ABS4MEZ5_9LACO|nr:NAD(P)-dependent dehydrogenase (short-subunit alcohol dehydrogenase family) [Lactobacillus colini]
MLWSSDYYKKKKRIDIEIIGKIINCSSQVGVVGSYGSVIYSGSKFAVRGITQSVAKELASQGITVNCYAPGQVDTPLLRSIAHKLGKQAGKDDEFGIKICSEGIALNRLSKPEDVANGVAFLASSDSDYMTGQTLEIDGGGMQFH